VAQAEATTFLLIVAEAEAEVESCRASHKNPWILAPIPGFPSHHSTIHGVTEADECNCMARTEAAVKNLHCR
jgi:hypothetical protein